MKVLITGTASGIGKAVAQEFLNIGANVVISDMAENAPEMDAKEGQLLYVRTDVTKVSDVEIPYENIEEFLKALKESIALCDSIPRSKPYAELNSDIGGGA